MKLRGPAILLLCLGCGTKAPPGPVGPNLAIETKVIVSHGLQPNVMLLVDRSNSMLANNSTVAPCPAAIGDCGPSSPCPAGCATRLSDLQTALDQVLTAPNTAHRVGLTVFPHDDICAAAGQSDQRVPLPGPSLEDDAIALQMQANAANTALKAVIAGGGSPTADSLRFVGGLTELTDVNRQNFVLLFTTGIPNCNANNPNTCADANACECTTSDCSGSQCTLGCANSDDTVAAVNELRAKNIKTIVATFNGGLSSNTASALNRLASAGGFARSCPMGTDAECGAGACNTATKLCNEAFFRADDANDLATQLTAMMTLGEQPDRCSIQLEHNPVDVEHLTVLVDGVLQAPCDSAAGCDTWVFEQSGGTTTVHFEGSTCNALDNATPESGVTLTFKIQQ